MRTLNDAAHLSTERVLSQKHTKYTKGFHKFHNVVLNNLSCRVLRESPCAFATKK